MAQELKFCHACHNEFYNGDICPLCGSDFIEKFEGGNDPSAFYDDDYDDVHDSDAFSYGSSGHIHATPPNSRPLQQPSSQGPSLYPPYQAPTTPNVNAFGIPVPPGTASPAQGGGGRPTSPPGGAPRQPANPMFMDGYRNILEQLLGGLDQVRNGPQPAQNYPPRYPTQPPQQPADPSRFAPFPVDGPSLGTGAPQPQPQPQPQQPRRHFHYSVTTYGPDGTVRQYTNSPRPDTPMAGGRQIVVPTLEDFLGMHMGAHMGATSAFPPPYGSAARGGTAQAPYPQGPEDPYLAVGGPLNMLAQMLESMAPLHGNPGDYLRPGMTMDDLITQLMDQGHVSTAPPPASIDAIDSLPRFKADKALADGGKECTVCKDNFSIGDDAIRLPCLHIFHEDCIIPWLKINGSCPVCRHTLNPNVSNSGSTSGPNGSLDNNAQSTSRGSPNGPNPSNPGGGGGAHSWLSSIGLIFGNRANASGGGNGNYGNRPESSRRTRQDSLPPEEDLD